MEAGWIVVKGEQFVGLEWMCENGEQGGMNLLTIFNFWVLTFEFSGQWIENERINSWRACFKIGICDNLKISISPKALSVKVFFAYTVYFGNFAYPFVDFPRNPSLKNKILKQVCHKQF